MDLESELQELAKLMSQESEDGDSEDLLPKSSKTGTQAPMRATYYLTGMFSPDRATSPRHQSGHRGVDLAAPAGTPIYPIAPGVIKSMGNHVVSGNWLDITHEDGLYSWYGHLSTVNVHKGDKVDYDTIIATVGNTGGGYKENDVWKRNVTFPHLHIEVNKNGTLQDPGKYFYVPSAPPKEIWDRLQKRNRKDAIPWWANNEIKEEADKFDIKKHIANKPKDLQAQLIDFYYKLCKS